MEQIQENIISGQKHKRQYGRIDDKVLIEAIASGMTLRQAGRLAGSKSTDKNIRADTYKKIQRNPTIKKSIIQKLEQRQHQILDSIRKEDILKAPLSQKSISLGIFIDKAQLLKGDATSRLEVMPKMVIERSGAEHKTLTEQEILKRIEGKPQEQSQE